MVVASHRPCNRRPSVRPRSPLPGDGRLTARPPRAWITRAEPGARATAARLHDLGFEPFVAPLIATRDLPGPPPDLTDVAALAFTSARGVRGFAERSKEPPSPPGCALPVFTVGDATAEAARAAGFADVRSAGGAGRDLLRLVLRDLPADALVLHAGAREPAFDLIGALTLVGRPARSAPLYETVAVERLPPPAAAALAEGGIDAVLIHSPAAARALSAALRAESAPPPRSLPAVVALSLPCALPLAGLPFAAVHLAKTPDESSLVEALLGAAPARG